MQQAARYRMPAEWGHHSGTWLAWPHNKEHWPGNFQPIPPVYAKIIAVLANSEKVFICVNNAAMEKSARAVLAEGGLSDGLLENIFFYHIPTNASWSRDHGPIFVKDEKGGLVITDWVFNCWGGKYPPWDLDDAVPQHVGRILQFPVIEPGIVLEGGSIDVNGRGTLLTTMQCLLHKNRNPNLTQKQIEQYLHDYLGATNILWLKEGIIGDDTDGHIDDIARFTGEKTIVAAVEEKKSDENYEILKKNREDLGKMRDQGGSLFHVVEIPMPDPIIYKGQRLPASYANFYIGNTVVLVPTFRCDKDEVVLQTLAKLFPARRIIGIDSVELVWGLGTLHCLSQQQPA